MIDVRKIPKEELSNCNCCGKYNQQLTYYKTNKENITKTPIYEYVVHYGNSGMMIRLCKDCAKKLMKELTKQIGEKV